MIDVVMAGTAASLVCASLLSIKRMSGRTCLMIYLAHALLATAGFIALLLPFFDVQHCWTHRWHLTAVALSCGGSALFLWANRRRRFTSCTGR